MPKTERSTAVKGVKGWMKDVKGFPQTRSELAAYTGFMRRRSQDAGIHRDAYEAISLRLALAKGIDIHDIEVESVKKIWAEVEGSGSLSQDTLDVAVNKFVKGESSSDDTDPEEKKKMMISAKTLGIVVLGLAAVGVTIYFIRKKK